MGNVVLSFFRSFSRLVRVCGRWGADALFPPVCLLCAARVGTGESLCAACWTLVRRVGDSACARCGMNLDFPVTAGAVCGPCLENPPAFTSARSVFLYDEASKPLVLRLKHGDEQHIAPAAGAWMAHAAGPEWLGQADRIVPVPLHRWRLFKRRYNQAALLAYAVGRAARKPVVPDLLVRVRATDSQGHKSRKERHDNVAGVFAVRSDGQDLVTGQAILLIDDVLTSGATANECARVLRQAGARDVYVLTLARAGGSR